MKRLLIDEEVLLCGEFEKCRGTMDADKSWLCVCEAGMPLGVEKPIGCSSEGNISTSSICAGS